MTCDIGRVLTLVNLGRFAVSMLPVTDDSMKSHPWHLWSALRLSMLPVTDDSMKSHPWHLWSASRVSMLPVTDDSMKSHPRHLDFWSEYCQQLRHVVNKIERRWIN